MRGAKEQNASYSINDIGKFAVFAFVLVLGASIGISAILAQFLCMPDLPAWVQAVGAILAIVAGFAAIYYQRVAQANDEAERQFVNARVALLIACQAMAVVGERLDAIQAPNRDKHPYRLRGARAGEMISSLREFDTTKIPPNLLEKFLQLRSNLFAINERITEIYESEKSSGGVPRQREERPQRLTASLDIWSDSRELLKGIRGALMNAGQDELAEPPKLLGFEQPS